MKQKHLARLAAFLVGATGAAAFGDHHGGGPIVGPQENCSNYPWWCWGQCAELNACRSGNTPIGGSNCAIEEANLRSCETSQPPYVPPVIVVPPPACPPGQHLTEGGQCQADHECGDDEIGGGSEECEPCGEGEVPNEEKTACVAVVECDWGEHPFEPGRCRCDDKSLDALAKQTMGNIPDEPWERGGWFQCIGLSPGVSSKTYSTEHETERCNFEHPVNDGIGKAAGTHTHPIFVWDRDEGLTCNGKIIESKGDVLRENSKGLGHSYTDILHAEAWGLPSYLSDSSRQLLVYRENAEGEWEEVPVP